MVNPIESGSIAAKTWEGASSARRGNLRVCHKRGLAHAEEVRSNRGNAVEETRKRKRLNLANVGAAETRNIANQAETEMIVKETEAAADNGLGSNRPGKPDARRHVVLLVKS